jgi:hypothetical protein
VRDPQPGQDPHLLKDRADVSRGPGSLIAAVTRAVARCKAIRQRERELRDEQARAALDAQQEAERTAIRARWAPANDPGWLGEANLLDTAVTWCAAVPL